MIDKQTIDAFFGSGLSASSNKVPVEPLSLGGMFGSLAPSSNALFTPFTSSERIARALWPNLPVERPVPPAPALRPVRKDPDGSWHLVERKPVELVNGNVEFERQRYMDHQPPVPKPKYVPDIGAGEIVPLSSFAKRYDFSGNSGSMNISTWMDVAAIEAGR